MTTNINRAIEIAADATRTVFTDCPEGVPAEVVARNVVRFLDTAGLLKPDYYRNGVARLPKRIHPIAAEEALLNIGMSYAEVCRLIYVPPTEIINTRDELANLDPDTVLFDATGDVYLAAEASECPAFLTMFANDLPAVVIDTGDQVRAARQALEEDK